MIRYSRTGIDCDGTVGVDSSSDGGESDEGGVPKGKVIAVVLKVKV